MSDDAPTDLDQELHDALEQQISLRRQGRNRSSLRLAQEVARRALSEKRLIPFLDAQFGIMNTTRRLFEPGLCKDACVAALALLENRQAATEFQPDFDEGGYSHQVHWLSACSYDNLAEATAQQRGYNSEGLHDCLAEGIQVCHRTGKRECLTCFHEYAFSTYRAADDLELAMFHARRNATTEPEDRDSDRRWVGARRSAELHLLLGRERSARAALLEARGLVDAYHDTRQARHENALVAEAWLAATGHEDDEVRAILEARPEAPPPGEDLEWEFRAALSAALAEQGAGRHDAALAPLEAWDRRLSNAGCLEPWFEVRLRRVGALRLAGRAQEAEPLARELERRAEDARDHLTLRRLRALFTASGATAGLALLAAPGAEVAQAPIASPDAEDAQGNTTVLEGSPVHEGLERAYEWIEQDPDADPLGAARDLDATDPAPDSVSLLGFLVEHRERMADPLSAWDWARSLAARDPDDGACLVLLAELGEAWTRREGSPLADRLSLEAVTRLFERAANLSPEDPMVLGRAGLHHLRAGSEERAERLLARAFRLDREHEVVTRNLSLLYQRSDRWQDAMGVLDVALRHGGETESLLRDAGGLAFRHRRYEEALTYFGRLEERHPGDAWAPYFIAQSLVGLERWDELGAALAVCRERTDLQALALDALEARLGEVRGDDAARDRAIRSALATPLHAADGLSESGLLVAFEHLLVAARRSALWPALWARALACGLAPGAEFRRLRRAASEAGPVGHFEVVLHQPLDATWEDAPERLAHQAGWTAYRVTYGVLAADREAAVSAVLDLHPGAGALEPLVHRVEGPAGEYLDHAGVTWQSLLGAPPSDEPAA